MNSRRISAFAALTVGAAAAAHALQTAPPPEEEGSRIVGGSPAAPGSAPWQAELFSTYKYTAKDLAEDAKLADSDTGKRFFSLKQGWERGHRCGGAYIGDDWVLTAAHCINADGDFLTARKVRLGTQNLALGGAEFALDRVVVHAGYRDNEPHPNDIALIRIARKGPLPAGVAAIRLLGEQPADRPLAAGDSLRVTGWGLTKARLGPGARALDGSVNRSSPMLMQVGLTALANAKCDAVPDYAGRSAATTICAGSTVPGRDACSGDSGGPLTRAQGRERVLVGVVSWGRGCALKGFPGIYTNVSAYRAWIERAKKGSKARKVISL